MRPTIFDLACTYFSMLNQPETERAFSELLYDKPSSRKVQAKVHYARQQFQYACLEVQTQKAIIEGI